MSNVTYFCGEISFDVFWILFRAIFEGGLQF